MGCEYLTSPQLDGIAAFADCVLFFIRLKLGAILTEHLALPFQACPHMQDSIAMVCSPLALMQRRTFSRKTFERVCEMPVHLPFYKDGPNRPPKMRLGVRP